MELESFPEMRARHRRYVAHLVRACRASWRASGKREKLRGFRRDWLLFKRASMRPGVDA